MCRLPLCPSSGVLRPPKRAAYNLTSTDGNRTFGTKAFNLPPSCQEPLFGWAPGPLSKAFSPEAGYRLGLNGSWASLVLQIHYTNAPRIQGVVDRSSIRLFATPTLRKHDLGVLITGPVEKLGVIPPGRPSFAYNSVCSFFSAGYPKVANWTVIAYNFHAHTLGRAFATEMWDKPDWATNSTTKVRGRARGGGNFPVLVVAATASPCVLLPCAAFAAGGACDRPASAPHHRLNTRFCFFLRYSAIRLFPAFPFCTSRQQITDVGRDDFWNFENQYTVRGGTPRRSDRRASRRRRAPALIGSPASKRRNNRDQRASALLAA